MSTNKLSVLDPEVLTSLINASTIKERQEIFFRACLNNSNAVENFEQFDSLYKLKSAVFSASEEQLKQARSYAVVRRKESEREKQFKPIIDEIKTRESSLSTQGWVLRAPDGSDMSRNLHPGVASNCYNFFQRLRQLVEQGEPPQLLEDSQAPEPDSPEPEPDSPPGSPVPPPSSSSSDDDDDDNEDGVPKTRTIRGKRRSGKDDTLQLLWQNKKVPIREDVGSTLYDQISTLMSGDKGPRIINMIAGCQSGKASNALVMAGVFLHARLVDFVLVCVGVGHCELISNMTRDSIHLFGEQTVKDCFRFAHLPNLVRMQNEGVLKRTFVIIDEAQWGLKLCPKIGTDSDAEADIEMNDGGSEVPRRKHADKERYLSRRLKEMGLLDYKSLYSNQNWVLVSSATPGSLAIDLEELGSPFVLDYVIRPGPNYVALEAIVNHSKFVDECGPFDPEIKIKPGDVHPLTQYRWSQTLKEHERLERWLEIADRSVAEREEEGDSRPVYHWMRLGGSGGHRTKSSNSRARLARLKTFLHSKDRLEDFAIVLLDSEIPAGFPMNRNLSDDPAVAISKVRAWFQKLPASMQAKYQSSMHLAVSPTCKRMIVAVLRFHFCAERVTTAYIASWHDKSTPDPAALEQSVGRLQGYNKTLDGIYIVAQMSALLAQLEYEKSGSYLNSNYKSPSIESDKHAKYQLVVGSHSAFAAEGLTSLPELMEQNAQKQRHQYRVRKNMWDVSSRSSSYNVLTYHEDRLAILEHVKRFLNGMDSPATDDYFLHLRKDEFRWLRDHPDQPGSKGINLLVIALTDYIDSTTKCISKRKWDQLLQVVQRGFQINKISQLRNPFPEPKSDVQEIQHDLMRTKCSLVHPEKMSVSLQYLIWHKVIRHRNPRYLGAVCYDMHDLPIEEALDTSCSKGLSIPRLLYVVQYYD